MDIETRSRLCPADEEVAAGNGRGADP